MYNLRFSARACLLTLGSWAGLIGGANGTSEIGLALVAAALASGFCVAWLTRA